MCDLPVTDQWLNSLCIGGLLDEVHSRPQPRVAVENSHKVAALILAAGSSTRAGEVNKLLYQHNGTPLVCSVVESVAASKALSCVVVTGHQPQLIEQAIGEYDVETVYCPNYANGMAHSIATGLSHLQSFDAALVCLGDMPHVGREIIDQIISCSDGQVADKIVVPVHGGRRGNPVMIGKTFFDSMLQHQGDSGARHLIKQYPEQVVEVEVDSDAIFKDYDTEPALKQLDS